MEKIVRAELSSYDRIIAISDVHGNLAPFESLLSRLCVTGRDALVLMGDYISRGEKSLETAALARGLAERDNVFALKGNHERLVEWYMRGPRGEVLGHTRHMPNLFSQWAAQEGFGAVTEENFAAVRRAFAQGYAREAEFLRELPFALESEEYIFVHAGVGPRADWENSAEQEFLKNDMFTVNGKNLTGKTVVAGHNPTWNLAEQKNSNNPVVLAGRKIIAVDGGSALKWAGQVNALVIEKGGISSVFEDGFEKRRVIKAHAPKDGRGCFRDVWPRFSLRLVERGEDFSLFENTSTGERGHLKNEHVEQRGGECAVLKNTVSTLLSVKEGETVRVVERAVGRHALVKKEDGAVGWVPAECIEDDGRTG